MLTLRQVQGFSQLQMNSNKEAALSFARSDKDRSVCCQEVGSFRRFRPPAALEGRHLQRLEIASSLFQVMQCGRDRSKQKCQIPVQVTRMLTSLGLLLATIDTSNRSVWSFRCNQVLGDCRSLMYGNRVGSSVRLPQGKSTFMHFLLGFG